MNCGHLFNGISGFGLAAHWMGWANVMHCEIDPFCNQVIKKHFPDSYEHTDIKTTDFTIWRGRIDLLTGGDPCQPHSVAGLGKGTEDDRFLWPEYFRAVREIQPPWVVNENVDGSIANGVLDLKINDLESEGYTCQAYSIPAEAVGALHQRERIWLIAYNANNRTKVGAAGKIQGKGEKKIIQKRNEIQHSGEPVDLRPFDTDADVERCREQYLPTEPGALSQGLSRYFGFGADAHGNIPKHIIESGIIRMLDGLPEGMDYSDRNKRIAALGNAIVPQVAYEIFKAIEAYEQQTTTIHP